MSWNPPRGYKGLRIGYRCAVRVAIKRDDRIGFNSIAYHTFLSDLYAWCEDNCKHNWSNEGFTFWFDKTNEAVMFKMIFGGR